MRHCLLPCVFHCIRDQDTACCRAVIRSGSAIHTDPLLTSAWNTSLIGRKRWMLFPPECRKVHLAPRALAELWPARLRGPSAWFEHVLPLVRSRDWRGSSPVEILQQPGERCGSSVSCHQKPWSDWIDSAFNLFCCPLKSRNTGIVSRGRRDSVRAGRMVARGA